MGSVLHQWSVFAYCTAREKKTSHFVRVRHAQKCHCKYMSMWAVPMKAILHGRCCQGWIKGSVTFPGFGMLSGKLIHITFRTFHNIRCLLIYNISRGKRLANIFSYKNSNSLLKVSLLEPAWSPAKYSYSLSLQPLIYAFLSKRHLEEVFIFSYQLLISVWCLFI